MTTRTAGIRGPNEAWRLFAAIPVDEPMQALIGEVQARLRAQAWAVRWVRPELAHITVRFFGDVPRGEVAMIAARLRAAARAARRGMLVADRLGAFPSPARPRVLWLGLRGDVDRLERLVADVDARFGVTRPPTERFVAHITLGRVRQEAGEVPDAADVLRRIEPPARTMPADRLLLVRSELGRDGPTYTTIGEWPLGSVEPREHG